MTIFNINNEAYGIYFDGFQVDTEGVRANGTAWNDKKANVDYCVFVYGCHTTTHPYIYLEINNGVHIWAEAQSAG